MSSAAAVAARKQREDDLTTRGIAEVIGDSMPSRHSMKCDPAEVGRQIVSVGGVMWTRRRMALTKSELCFSKVGSDVKADYIPCHEIALIQGLEHKNPDPSPATLREDKSPVDRTKANASSTDKMSPLRASMTHSSASRIHVNEFQTINIEKRLSRANSNESLSGMKHGASIANVFLDLADSGRGGDGHDFAVAANDASEEGVVPECVLILKTIEDGHNSGRDTVIQFDSIDSCNAWSALLLDVVKAAKLQREKDAHKSITGLYVRARAKEFYHSKPFEMLVMTLILCSTFVAVSEKQMVPHVVISSDDVSAEDVALFETFQTIDLVFTVFFAVELSINLFAHWWKEFVRSNFNWFDSFVVLVSIFSRVDDSLPGMNVVRLFRCLRMVRLFRANQELRVLLNALVSSMVPVLYSFLLFLLVISMFAVVATDFFGVLDPEEFGRFFDSLFSLFQIATGDSWASNITRKLADDAVRSGMYSSAFVKIFFTTYMLIVGMVLCNIVVAVLLDSFLSAMLDSKREKALAELKAMQVKGVAAALCQDGPLDALVKGFLTVSREDDLRSRIRQVYSRLDADHSNGLTLDEINVGLKQFDSFNAGNLSREEWDILCDNGKHLNEHGEMTLAGFEGMIMMQMRQYVNRRLLEAMARLDDNTDVEQAATLFALRQTMLYSFQTGELVQDLRQKIDPISKAASASTRLSNRQKRDALALRPKRWAFRQWSNAVMEDNGTETSTTRTQNAIDLAVDRIDTMELVLSTVLDKVSDIHHAVGLQALVQGHGDTEKQRLDHGLNLEAGGQAPPMHLSSRSSQQRDHQEDAQEETESSVVEASLLREAGAAMIGRKTKQPLSPVSPA